MRWGDEEYVTKSVRMERQMGLNVKFQQMGVKGCFKPWLLVVGA